MHLCSSKKLETELYDYVTKSDLKEARKLFGDTKDCHMLWKFRMKRHHYSEDSSSDEEVDTSVKVIVVVLEKPAR